MTGKAEAKEVNVTLQSDPTTITTAELADLLRYALGEAMDVIEHGKPYVVPTWMHAVWSFAWHALIYRRRRGLLVEMHKADEMWPQVIDRIVANAFSEEMHRE